MKGRTEREAAENMHGDHAPPCIFSHSGLMCGSRPDELVARNRTLPVHSDGSQGLLAGGSEGDRGAGGDQGGPKGEPRRPPLEPLHLHGQHAHACWASSLTAKTCACHRSVNRSAGPWSSSASVPSPPQRMALRDASPAALGHRKHEHAEHQHSNITQRVTHSVTVARLALCYRCVT